MLRRIARLLLLVWLADALHVRMSAATNPNQWREFRKDQIVQQRAESPPTSTATTVSSGDRASRSPHPSPHLHPNHTLTSSPDRPRSPATHGGSMSLRCRRRAASSSRSRTRSSSSSLTCTAAWCSCWSMTPTPTGRSGCSSTVRPTGPSRTFSAGALRPTNCTHAPCLTLTLATSPNRPNPSPSPNPALGETTAPSAPSPRGP